MNPAGEIVIRGHAIDLFQDPEYLAELRHELNLADRAIGAVLFDGLLAARAVCDFIYAGRFCASRVTPRGERCELLMGHEGEHRWGSVSWSRPAN